MKRTIEGSDLFIAKRRGRPPNDERDWKQIATIIWLLGDGFLVKDIAAYCKVSKQLVYYYKRKLNMP